jgi:hypothetical protein
VARANRPQAGDDGHAIEIGDRAVSGYLPAEPLGQRKNHA